MTTENVLAHLLAVLSTKDQLEKAAAKNDYAAIMEAMDRHYHCLVALGGEHVLEALIEKFSPQGGTS
jgi:hypothetical protein